jgi:hypothetical protein
MGPTPPSQSSFKLSADGKTLTETDVTDQVTVNYSCQESVSAGIGDVSQG